MFNKKNENKDNNQPEDNGLTPLKPASSLPDEYSQKFFNNWMDAEMADIGGEFRYAIYLYLAAFEQAKRSEDVDIDKAIGCLQRAWKLAIGSEDRPLVEHIFEILSKHLSDKELDFYAEDLHNLMLDKLKTIGFPVDSIQDAKELGDTIESMKRFAKGVAQENSQTNSSNSSSVDNEENPNNMSIKDKLAKQFEQTKDSRNKTGVPGAQPYGNQHNNPVRRSNRRSNIPAQHGANETMLIKKDVLKYKDLIGYDTAIRAVRKTGLGMESDSQYNQLVQQLNAEHGLERIAFSETFMFVSESRVDAKMFMEATAGEIGLPCMHMHVDESISGANVLCLMGPADSDFQLNPGRTGFNGKGILMLEDVDTWDFPSAEPADNDDLSAFLAAQMNRGVYEIVNLIKIAVEDPNILVIATMKEGSKNTQFINQVLSPYRKILIDYPNTVERAAIWASLANDHPSLRAFSTQKLVSLSEKLSRYDITIAVHEALEDAYKRGIEKREFVPLTIMNIVEKLAEHQPLESKEYKNLEDAAITDFRKDLENIDELLN